MRIQPVKIIIILLIGSIQICHAARFKKSLLLEHCKVIEQQIRQDLNYEISDIENLEIIPIPIYEISMNSWHHTSLKLDTSLNFAIILSNGEFVDYALKFRTDSFKLRKIKEDTTIYIGRGAIYNANDVWERENKGKKSKDKKLFAIYAIHPIYMMGFGCYTKGRVHYIGFPGSEMTKYNSRYFFFKSVFRKKRDYENTKKIFKD